MSGLKKPLLILGSGKFAVDVADFASEIGDWRIEGFVQNVDRNQTSTLEGLPVYWTDEAFRHHPESWAVCALGSQRRVEFIEQAAAEGARFATLVHPFTRVSRQVELGEGSIVSPGAVIAARASIGRHVIINRGASIGHHVEIGDYSFLAPGVTVCGSVVIGTGAFIGAGSVVCDHVTIGHGAFIGAGALVVRNISDGDRVLGIPAASRRSDPDAGSQ